MRGWSWSIGRFFGIDTRIHATFLLIVAWAVFSGLGGGPGVALVSLLFLLAVFAVVLFHELGHALTARHFGVGTRRIIISPLGGLAELEGGRLPPRVEFWVALAGPAVSLVLAGVLFAIGGAIGALSPVTFVGGLAWANLLIALFNLVPALPMDGGRVLRAFLAARRGHRQATAIAARVARVLALVMIGAGILWRPLLAVIGVFVYLASRAEARAAELDGGDDSFRDMSFGSRGRGAAGRPRGAGAGGVRSWFERWRERRRLGLDRRRVRLAGPSAARGPGRRLPEQVIVDRGPGERLSDGHRAAAMRPPAAPRRVVVVVRRTSWRWV